MSGIPEDVIEQVRDAADIVGVIGEHVNLRRTGSDFRGPCPFHGGTHRNLAVIPKKQMFYCFVCHEGGDVFTFLMKRHGLEYPAAVREVARRCGISIPERPSGGPDPREPLFSAVAVAAEWYAERLREADDAGAARRYLAARGFDLEALAPLGLGFAPKGGEFLEAMERLGVADTVLAEAGLALERDDGSVRPRFWNRLLFPIHDLRGRVVAFGGRLVDDGEPKYLNSPESPIYHKGALLYHLHAAKYPIRRAGRAVVVEGYFDVLRLAGVGVEEVVAPLGTALTTDQARLLKRYTDDVILVYDSDGPGMRASFRAADELLRVGLRVVVATLPPGKDPDLVAREGGPAAVQRLLGDAQDVFERKLQLLMRKGWLATLAGRRRALDRLLPTLRAPSDAVTRDLYLGRAAEALGVSLESVRREVAQRDPPPPAGREMARAPTRRRLGHGVPEHHLLQVMLREPAWRRRIAEQARALEFRGEAERALLGALAASDPDVDRVELLEALDDDARLLLRELDDRPWGTLDVDALVEGALRQVESRSLERRLRDIDRRMTIASEDEKVELVREMDSLNREIRRLNPSRWNVLRKGRSSAR